MTEIAQFRTARLSGRPPSQGALALYKVLFGAHQGAAQLQADTQDWTRHQVAPWVLSHASNAVGVGGFRIGFGGDGLELSFHFLQEMWGQGLATEFVRAALDYAADTLNADRVFAQVADGDQTSFRILEKAGFEPVANEDGGWTMKLALAGRS